MNFCTLTSVSATGFDILLLVHTRMHLTPISESILTCDTVSGCRIKNSNYPETGTHDYVELSHATVNFGHFEDSEGDGLS